MCRGPHVYAFPSGECAQPSPATEADVCERQAVARDRLQRVAGALVAGGEALAKTSEQLVVGEPGHLTGDVVNQPDTRLCPMGQGFFDYAPPDGVRDRVKVPPRDRVVPISLDLEFVCREYRTGPAFGDDGTLVVDEPLLYLLRVGLRVGGPCAVLLLLWARRAGRESRATQPDD